ncbi:hypothetical protein JCM33374_g4575 [Metschnikowia sp. JCM 33374]|nr:hypothetical protein JCM33374_g4575 [Metschnikowia sp. JCM 33374]
MSDRVARLAEIRRKRKAQETNNGSGVDTQQVSLAEQKEKAVSTHVTKPEDGNPDENELQESASGEKIAETLDIHQKEDVPTQKPGILPKTGPDSSADEKPASQTDERSTEAPTYNTDLKWDLEPYLRKARIDTDRALNKLLQEKYQEAARANAEDA